MEMETKLTKMKSRIIIIVAFCLLPLNLFSQEKVDTIAMPGVHNVYLPDSIVKVLANNVVVIDSLTNANTALKGLLKDSQKEAEAKERDIASLNRKIDDLQNVTIKRLEASNDTLQRRLISMASNFLYIPYDEYSIEEIALPAFLSTKGTPAYTRYQNRLPLLQNYRDDISTLVTFLMQAEKDVAIRLTKLREDKAKEHLSSIRTLPLFIRYSSYDDWQNTYLGSQICVIQKYLQTPSESTSTQLKTIRTKLESLLNSI